MAFDYNQPNYRALRQIMAERTNRITVFCGAGLSKPAGLPTWSELRNHLQNTATAHIANRDPKTVKREQALINLAESENDPWLAFKHLRTALGDQNYHAEVRNKLGRAATVKPPEVYDQLWRLPISGFINLNIDGLASRSFAQVFSGAKYLREFSGIDCARHLDLLTTNNLFVINLHGIISDTKSWIFTASDLEELFDIDAYGILLQTIFTSQHVLFIGVSADDIAISHHLQKLKAAGFQGGNHFWITHRSDQSTIDWTNKLGVRTIYYSSSAGDHSEVPEIVRDISRFSPIDETPPPVRPSISRERGFILPTPEELERLSSEEIRQALNKEADRLLADKSEYSISQYRKFWENYSDPIHRSWVVNTTPGRNVFMSYTIKSPVAKGGFGTIYEGIDKNGQRIALKILHNAAKDDQETIQGFRRGVRAMRILSERKIQGMVPYEAAWEIPPCAVMQFIDGPNLKLAVESGALQDWPTRLKVAIELTQIIQSAHSVPERVLHRDIRPANIMLDDLWSDSSDFRVVVLDFDLAWHRDAPDHSMSITHSVNGYLAPELTSEGEYSSRNALVDSYGLGMTFFFMVAKRHPLFAESKYADWDQKLAKDIKAQICGEWKSLPARWARIIKWTTQPKQPDRWDVPRILGELNLLYQAIKSPSSVISAELLAEELLARTREGAKRYEWHADQLHGDLEIREGYILRINADESSKLVGLQCDWMNTGVMKFENVKKYMIPAAEKAESILRNSGWTANKVITSDSVRITAKISAKELQSIQSLVKAAGNIDLIIESLKLGRI